MPKSKTGFDIEKLPVFSPQSDFVFQITEQQFQEINLIFEKMHREIQSDYQFKYDLLRNYLVELIHYGQKLQPVKPSFSVMVNAPGSGRPSGTVTVSDGAGATCAATLPATSCSLTSTTVGSNTLTAAYSGDSNFAGSSGTSTQQEVVNYLFTGFFSPLVSAGTFSHPSNSGTGNLGHAIPIKWSLQDGAGNFLSNLNTTVLLEAIGNPSCSGAPTGQATLLYSPTVGAKGGSTFRFSTNQFVFNWDTSTGVTSGCYTIVLQLNDGSALKATTIFLK